MERGRDADWVGNLQADPRVAVRLRSRRPSVWRSGTANIVGDDPGARRRIHGRTGRWRRLCMSASAAPAGDVVTIRIDLKPAA
jgi:hypothetical protein